MLRTQSMSNNLLISFHVLRAWEELNDAEASLRVVSRAPLDKDYTNLQQEHASAVGKL